ncbi:MAG: radical SAM family heme chaperone HemW [Kiritimatiellia bacterium]
MISHLYLHVPFCTGRCRYCAFLSHLPFDQLPSYVETLCEEARIRAVPLAALETLYCGGGTPSLLGEGGFEALMSSGIFTLRDDSEWTVELHPATVTESLVRTLAGLGVNRFSIGVQSFNDETLARCQRRHSVAQAYRAIDIARKFVPDTGIDLIAGLPEVSPNEWEQTIRATMALALPHVSVYALSMDAGSLWHQEGRLPPDADCVCDALLFAQQALETTGLRRYEMSNYAKPGFECRHNVNTWHGADYLGLGQGAASRNGLTRRENGHEETLSIEADALERSLTQLRLQEGFNLDATIARFPCLAPRKKRWSQRLAEFQAQGLLTAYHAPTARGYEVLDAMERALLC